MIDYKHKKGGVSDSSSIPIGLKYSRLYLPIVISVCIYFLLIASHFFIKDNWIIPFHLILSIVGLYFLFRITSVIKCELYVPFIHIRNWSLRVKETDYSVRLPTNNEHTEFNKLATDLNVLTEILQFLSDEFQDKVEQQTSIIKDQDDSLKILYETATSINNSHHITDTFNDFLKILLQLTSAHAGAIRLAHQDPLNGEQLKIVASSGLSESFLQGENLVSIGRCLCGQSFNSGQPKQIDTISDCAKLANASLFEHDDSNMIVVPIEYQGKYLGIYNLYISKNNINVNNKDHEELLITVGKQLGIAIEKSKLSSAAKQNSVMKERTLLAHELHDSLAQTLASLRFQVTIMEENIHEQIPLSRNEIDKLHGSIDEAYTEVRALITHFRAPINNSGLIPSITKLVENFKANNNILIFFQNNWQDQSIKSDDQYQIIRIIQECLGNIKKHSQAKTVRLMIKTDDIKNEVLIEDDGIGIQNKELDSSLGEHIGLSVIQERAQRMGGTLSIESEAGEGTQILLEFPVELATEETI